MPPGGKITPGWEPLMMCKLWNRMLEYRLGEVDTALLTSLGLGRGTFYGKYNRPFTNS